MTDKIIKQALERFELAEEAETTFRRNAEEDLKFVSGDQWNQQAKSNRENAGLTLVATFLSKSGPKLK